MKTERQLIFKAVIEAMQRAEEMGGPDEEYTVLMADIAVEALTRIKNFRTWTKPKRPMSFEEFQKTGRNARLAEELPGIGLTEFGRIYGNEDKLHIQLMSNGTWLLEINGEENMHNNLYELEKLLYKFYLEEVA